VLSFLLLFLFIFVIFLTGCEKDGVLKITNRTSYPINAAIYNSPQVIPPGSVLKKEITTERQSLFGGDVGKYVDLDLEGETYEIWDYDLEAYVPNTRVFVKAGQTTKVYLDPNRACIKVINQSGWNIKKVIIQQNSNSETSTNPYIVFLENNDVWYKQVDPATATESCFYIIQIVFENDTIVTYGDNQNILYTDEEFLITVTPPPKN